MPLPEKLAALRNTVFAWDVDPVQMRHVAQADDYHLVLASRRPNTGYNWSITHQRFGALETNRYANTISEARAMACDAVEAHMNQLAEV